MSNHEYICEREDVFDRLKDQTWFFSFIKHQYRNVVFGNSLLAPVFSDYWISQAFLRWSEDLERVSKNEYDGKPLDHFKRAGFLCYWLRRCPPIAEFGHNPDMAIARIKLREAVSPIEKFHGNHWGALDIGFRLCRFRESNRKDKATVYGQDLAIGSFNLNNHKDFVQDFCYILSEKNISPHAIAIIYRSLFIQARGA